VLENRCVWRWTAQSGRGLLFIFRAFLPAKALTLMFTSLKMNRPGFSAMYLRSDKRKRDLEDPAVLKNALKNICEVLKEELGVETTWEELATDTDGLGLKKLLRKAWEGQKQEA
jgi:hypothetical protein